MNCEKCGAILEPGANFCRSCGSPVKLTTTYVDSSNFLIVTTPTIPGYKIKQIYGLVTGFTPRTRGFFGQFQAGIESFFGGEITAFTTEVEKARWEAINRTKDLALRMGANAIIGLDVETSSIGQTNIVLFSATGTAVLVEKE